MRGGGGLPQKLRTLGCKHPLTRAGLEGAGLPTRGAPECSPCFQKGVRPLEKVSSGQEKKSKGKFRLSWNNGKELDNMSGQWFSDAGWRPEDRSPREKGWTGAPAHCQRCW